VGDIKAEFRFILFLYDLGLAVYLISKFDVSRPNTQIAAENVAKRSAAVHESLAVMPKVEALSPVDFIRRKSLNLI